MVGPVFVMNALRDAQEIRVASIKRYDSADLIPDL
jgi:hypothetical protein